MHCAMSAAGAAPFWYCWLLATGRVFWCRVHVFGPSHNTESLCLCFCAFAFGTVLHRCEAGKAACMAVMIHFAGIFGVVCRTHVCLFHVHLPGSQGAFSTAWPEPCWCWLDRRRAGWQLGNRMPLVPSCW